MTEKELGKLNRRELLEMMLQQTKRIEELEAELNEKNSRLAEKDSILAEKSINLEKAGNIAEAALQVSKVFEAAQTAAAIYLENIEARSKRCDDITADTKKRCEDMLADTKKRCEFMLADTKKRCTALEKQTAERVQAFKADVERLTFGSVKQPSE